MPPSASRVVPLTGFSGVWSTSGTTFSGTAGVNTAWIEVTASCPADLAGFYVVPSPDNDTTRTAGRFVIDVGIGALGSEVVRWSFQGAQSAGGIAGPFIGPIFDAIPAGSRIVWRARRAGGGIDAIACIFYGLAA
jgi:hypothetical protein